MQKVFGIPDNCPYICMVEEGFLALLTKTQHTMIRKTKKARKYQAPCAQETHVAFETNICSVVFNVEVQELENINQLIEKGDADAEPLYFEF